jgi:hypothetical protein
MATSSSASGSPAPAPPCAAGSGVWPSSAVCPVACRRLRWYCTAGEPRRRRRSRRRGTTAGGAGEAAFGAPPVEAGGPVLGTGTAGPCGCSAALSAVAAARGGGHRCGDLITRCGSEAGALGGLRGLRASRSDPERARWQAVAGIHGTRDDARRAQLGRRTFAFPGAPGPLGDAGTCGTGAGVARVRGGQGPALPARAERASHQHAKHPSIGCSRARRRPPATPSDRLRSRPRGCIGACSPRG